MRDLKKLQMLRCLFQHSVFPFLKHFVKVVKIGIRIHTRIVRKFVRRVHRRIRVFLLRFCAAGVSSRLIHNASNTASTVLFQLTIFVSSCPGKVKRSIVIEFHSAKTPAGIHDIYIKKSRSYQTIPPWLIFRYRKADRKGQGLSRLQSVVGFLLGVLQLLLPFAKSS